MHTLKHERQLFVLLLLGAGVSLLLVFLRGTNGRNYIVSPTLPSAPNPTPTPTIDPATQIQTTVLDSPDGKQTLLMKSQKKNTEITATFYTSSKSEPTEKELITKTVDAHNTFSLPFNSWSSDYRYVFVKETTPVQNNFYVFTISGKPISGEEQDVNITDLFMKKFPDAILEDVTGWASPTLLIVNAKLGDTEASYWFEIPSKAFIRLSNRFN